MNISPKTIALVNKFNQHLLKKKNLLQAPLKWLKIQADRQTDKLEWRKGKNLSEKHTVNKFLGCLEEKQTNRKGATVPVSIWAKDGHFYYSSEWILQKHPPAKPPGQKNSSWVQEQAVHQVSGNWALRIALPNWVYKLLE